MGYGTKSRIYKKLDCIEERIKPSAINRNMWQNQKAKPKSNSTRSKKVTKLDNVFSRFIRRRDCGFTYGRCISCDKIITFDDCDCGHYHNRSHMALRYDEFNCNAQCRSCNRFSEGNVQGYRKGLIEKIGEKATDNLDIKKHNSSKLSEAELDILISYYNQKLKDIEKQ